MRYADINKRKLAQRARRDAEAELRDPAPQYPAHGSLVGSITFTLHGQTVTVEFLSTGKHSRTHGVRINGELRQKVMGVDRAWREASKLMPRMMSLRRAV